MWTLWWALWGSPAKVKGSEVIATDYILYLIHFESYHLTARLPFLVPFPFLAQQLRRSHRRFSGHCLVLVLGSQPLFRFLGFTPELPTYDAPQFDKRARQLLFTTTLDVLRASSAYFLNSYSASQATDNVFIIPLHLSEFDKSYGIYCTHEHWILAHVVQNPPKLVLMSLQ